MTLPPSPLDPASLTQEINLLHADLCSALADPTRILILYYLSERQHNVGELEQRLGVSQANTSRHLKVLRERGLVTAVRNGQSVVYSLNDPRVIQALDTLRLVLRDALAARARIANA